MPPRKRAKRAIDAPSTSRTQRGINASGFAVLPAELHAEILSHLPRYPVRCDPLEKSALDKEGLDRQFTLHSLSRTCSALRAACLPFLWEGIEVYEGFKIPRKGTRLGKIPLVNFHVADDAKIPNARGCRNYAEELLRQLEVVTVRNPALARHVKFLNVTLTQLSLSAIREELIRCLSLFPSMTTVRMVIWDGPDPRYFTSPEGISFPQIRTLYLNGGSDWFSSLCPNARSISFSSEYELLVCQDSFYWLSAARPIGAQIEVLGLFPFQHRSNVCMSKWLFVLLLMV
ncbi:hypothetical protein BJ165DRAFT_255221 [Panaeolus papilionaceus]|nr:hypothetical protein BJ165DRAFT_255221 [Panaeolus papilionaceus]